MTHRKGKAMRDRELREKIANVIDITMVLLTKEKCLEVADQILALFPSQEEVERIIISQKQPVECIHDGSGIVVKPKDLAHALTHPVAKEQEYCKCKTRAVVYSGKLTQEQKNSLPCAFCGKPTHPQGKPEGEIEELKIGLDYNQEGLIYGLSRKGIDKINELVRDNKKLWEAINAIRRVG